MLKGNSEPQEQVLVSGHYDTINLTCELYGPGTAAPIAPGVTDDGSGTAAARHDHIEALFNNDIIGSNVRGKWRVS